MAMGTPLNLPFFFLVPGYSQTGNPARCLVLAAFALAALAAVDLDSLLSDVVTPGPNAGRVSSAIAVLFLLAAIGVNASMRFAAASLPGTPFGPLFNRALPGVQVAAVLLAITAAALFALPSLVRERQDLGAVILAVCFRSPISRHGGTATTRQHRPPTFTRRQTACGSFVKTRAML